MDKLDRNLELSRERSQAEWVCDSSYSNPSAKLLTFRLVLLLRAIFRSQVSAGDERVDRVKKFLNVERLGKVSGIEPGQIDELGTKDMR